MGLGDSIKLSEAPALLFANAWSRIVSLKGGEEKALQALVPYQSILVTLRTESIKRVRER